jgi:dihydrolipoamide dehydrogenase
VVEFDLLIIGTGPAGLAALETAAELGGARVAIIEAAARLGGECPNWGCAPTKTLLRSAEVLGLARRAASFGLRGELTADFTAVMARKQGVVDALTGGTRLEDAIKTLGAELLRGRAKFVAPDAVEIGGRRVTFAKCVVGTGSTAVVPPVPGLAEAGYLTSDDLVAIKERPASLAIIGGGPIGVEFAQVFAALGTDVTVVEYAPHLLPREEAETAAVAQASLVRQGVRVRVGAKAVGVKLEGARRTLEIQPAAGGASEFITADQLLVATGKRPALAGLEVAAAAITLDQRGNPQLDEFLRSSNQNVYFAGDAAGQMLFTHVAHEQGVTAVKNALRGDTVRNDLSVIPRATFCEPPVASVGLTEAEARAKGIDVLVGRGQFATLGKALASGEMEGLCKLVVDRASGLIVGAHVVGPTAPELIHLPALCMRVGLSAARLAELTYASFTYAEAVGVAAASLE